MQRKLTRSATGRVFKYVNVLVSYERAVVSPVIILNPAGNATVFDVSPPRPKLALVSKERGQNGPIPTNIIDSHSVIRYFFEHAIRVREV
jgi:hypothetical protein